MRRNYGVLTELIASVNKVFGNLKGQQEVARISLPVHGLHKTEDKVGTQTLKFCGKTKQGHIMWKKKKSFATLRQTLVHTMTNNGLRESATLKELYNQPSLPQN